MQDTHEFFGLLRQFGAERQQSFRLVEGQFTQRLQTQAVPWLLERSARDGLPIMVFVGSGGCIQIHTGPVHTIRPMDTAEARWINVLDKGFNLHLRTDLIAYVYNCTLYDLQDGTIDPATFSQSTDIWALMGTPNPARFTTYGNPVQVDTCPNVYTYVAGRLPAEVARAASTPEMAAEMYLASVLLVDEEHFMERAYLDELARQLKLDPTLKGELEAQVRQISA